MEPSITSCELGAPVARLRTQIEANLVTAIEQRHAMHLDELADTARPLKNPTAIILAKNLAHDAAERHIVELSSSHWAIG